MVKMYEKIYEGEIKHLIFRMFVIGKVSQKSAIWRLNNEGDERRSGKKRDG